MKKYDRLYCDVFRLLLVYLGLTSSFANSQNPVSKVVICYYDATSYWREGVGRFMATDIDPFLCTHVVYSFLGIKESSSRIYSRDPGLDFGPDEIEMDPDDELNYQGDLDMIRKTIQLRDGEEGNSTNLKILISVGGPNQSPSTFSIMAQNPGRRQQFVASAVEYMQQFNLDGLDLYWIYPSNETDKQNFVEVVKNLKEAFTTLSSTTGKSYTLSAALGCTEDVIDRGYNLEGLAEYVDYFNLLCFDFKQYSNETESAQQIGHHSPLSWRDLESIPDQKLTVAHGINYFLQKNAPAAKLVVGVAAYGRTYKLQSPALNNFYDVASGPGPPGNFTILDGFLAYFEICALVKENPSSWVFRYDYEYHIPYLSNGNALHWIGYENEISVQEKVDFTIDKGLAGMMVKFIDLDDSRNICGAWYSFSLTATIKDRLEFWGLGF